MTLQNPEDVDRLGQQTLQQFADAINYLENQPYPDLSQCCDLVIQRLARREIMVAIGMGGTNAITDAQLHPVRDGRGINRQFASTVIIDAPTALGNFQQLQLDTVRTVFLLATMPIVGYERPLRSVYAQAIRRQIGYLEAMGIPRAAEDPRNFTLDEAVDDVLDPVRACSDAGYKDWQTACDTYLAEERKKFRQHPWIASMRDNPMQFVIARALYTKEVHEEEVFARGGAYYELASAERAKVFASSLLSHVIEYEGL